jgi:hypothetical protein
MRFADMSLDVICKWRPSQHIYSEKMAGGRRREAVESAGRKIGGNAVAPKTVGGIRTCG